MMSVDCATAAPIVIVTGFVASTLEGTRTTLKRSGSDFSATIFARLMGASRITMWKNVNGVYTADPRRVPEAFPIEGLKYEEAIELAFFGAQVLHPSAMQPCIEGKIPIYVRNFENPEHPGTVIEGRACSLEDQRLAWETEKKSTASSIVRKTACPVRLREDESPIRGITSVDNVAILNIEGTGTSEVPDLTSTLSRVGVGITMLTQASSDASMCIVIEEGGADKALAALEDAFEVELNKGLVAGITIERDHSVVAIVGEGMAFRPGMGATFTKAMATAGVNIRTIAQGSSERQIAICVEKSDCTKALRAAHAALALSNTQLCVAVIGATGQVGREFLQQIADSRRVIDDVKTCGRRKALDELRLDFKVTALAKSDAMRLSYDGIQDCAGADCMSAQNDNVEPTDLEELTRFLNEDYNGNRVVVDCTGSEDVASYYPRWLGLGIHVVSANKKGGAGTADLYDECRRLALTRAQWLYETTGPGSGLPVLSALKDMTQSGDVVKSVRGIFSGTTSFILNAMKDGQPLSQALEAAVAKGLCEPDPRDDLDGVDVRRKVVVLARELGLTINLADVAWEGSLLPAELVKWKPDTSAGAPSVAMQLVEALKPYDEEISTRVKALMDGGKTPVQLCAVDVEAGTATVSLDAVDSDTRFARCLANENVVEIFSRRYNDAPMVLQGPGAGAGITASGLFADVLRLSRTLVDWNIPQLD